MSTRPGSDDPGDARAPRTERPHVPEYGIPASVEGTLPWQWAREQLQAALTYWVATPRPDGRPHLMPTWGVWVGDAFYWEGGLETRRARNVALRGDVVVSVGGDEAAVIIEGHAVRVTDQDAALEAELVAAFGKYTAPFAYSVDPANWRTGGLWRVDPTVGFGWTSHGYPGDATRWRFG